LPLFDPPTSSEIASNNLQNLAFLTAVAARRLSPKAGKSNSAYKNGWSTTFIALKDQSMDTLQILGHFQGTRGRRIWEDKHDQHVGIKIIMDRWVKAVHKLS